MNILVTGADGQLGREIVAVSDSKNRYFYTDVNELDITNIDEIRQYVNLHKINIVINCAAYTAVDIAEDNQMSANEINNIAVEYLATVCRENNATLFHISTDYVFDGESNVPYKESDECNPIGVYGKSKRDGEKAVVKSGCNYVIIRTAWLYSEYGNNFVKTMLNLTSTKTSIKVVDDQKGSPTYAADLARTIVEIINNGSYVNNSGIYHFSNEGECTWWGFASDIAVQAGNLDCKIEKCSSDEFPSKVTRPKYSLLDKTKIKETFKIEVRDWRIALAECLVRIKNKK